MNMFVPGNFYSICGTGEVIILAGKKDCDILAADAAWLFSQKDGITLATLPNNFDPSVMVRELRKNDLPAYLYLHQYPGMEKVMKGTHPWVIA